MISGYFPLFVMRHKIVNQTCSFTVVTVEQFNDQLLPHTGNSITINYYQTTVCCFVSFLKDDSYFNGRARMESSRKRRCLYRWTRKKLINLGYGVSELRRVQFNFCFLRWLAVGRNGVRYAAGWGRIRIKVNQPHYRPEVPRGFQEVKVPRLRDNRHMKVVSLTHRPLLPPGTTPGTHFC